VGAKKPPASRPRIFASDRDAAVCTALAAEVQRNGLAGVIDVACQDFMSLTPEKLPLGQPGGPKGLVVLNPPYGVRLGGRKGARHAIAAMGAHLRAHWRGWRLAVLLPEPDLERHFGPGLNRRRLGHGGLKLTLIFGQLR
jgi:putative N6-adenine-specific DNA methylase